MTPCEFNCALDLPILLLTAMLFFGLGYLAGYFKEDSK